MVPLVGDDLFDHDDRVLAHRSRGFELLGGLGKRLLNRRRVAAVRTWHGDADDRAGVEIDGVFGLVRRMRSAVLHSRDLGVRSCGWVQSCIRALLLPLPIDPSKSARVGVPSADPGRFCERRQELFIALAAIASHDAPQRRVRIQRGRVDACPLAFDQAGCTETLTDPCKHGPMRFERDEAARPRNCRVVRRRLVQPDSQEIA